MNEFDRSKWNHPSMKNRIDAEIAMMEAAYGDEAHDANHEPPAYKRSKRGGRRKPRGFGMTWRY